MANFSDTALPADVLQAVDGLCDAFDSAWAESRRPAIEDSLAAVALAARPVLLEELVRIELEWRWRLGEQPSAAEYRTRFPDCVGVIDLWLAEAKESAAQMADADARDTPTRDAPATKTPCFSGVAPTMAPVQMIGGYEVRERLGAGGMGEVYRARHVRLDKLVALKVLPVGARHSRERLARFLREMKAVGALDHPNVVEAHDAGEGDGVVYLAMKLIDGIDLQELVRSGGPLPVAEACALVRQAALGLHYLHERRLVHRDVKPSNLMRTRDGVVKVLDLGLARGQAGAAVVEELTSIGHPLGTPDFMSPEQVRGEEADARSDVYGLGGTLFYLLTAQGPFEKHKPLHHKLRAHEEEPPPDVCRLRPEVPSELGRLVARMLAKQPGDRPQTAEEVAAVLVEFVEPAAPPQPPRQRTRRRQLALAAAGLLGAALLGLGIWARLRQPPPTGPASSANPSASEVTPRTQPQPLTIDLRVYRCDPDAFNIDIVGELGQDVFRVRRNDPVTVEAKLSEPAYAYLIAFNPADKPEHLEQIVPLAEANTQPQKRDRLGSMSRRLLLNDGEGLQVFAVLASRQPLPAYAEWKKQRPPLGWQRTAATSGLVWTTDGSGLRPVFDARFRRAEEVDKADERTVIRALADKLQGLPGIEAVALVAFAVDRLD
jgi:serine/threonine protein kinase